MKYRKGKIKETWNRVRHTSRFRDTMLFLVFILVSTLFWFILALNDNVQDSFQVGIHITDIPDSVTIINDIPEKIHVSVRDKGTNIWRKAILKKPVLNLNFKDYAADNIFRVSSADFQSALKSTFSTAATVNILNVDSLVLSYTTNKGKRVPVVVRAQILPASGTTLEGQPSAEPSYVIVYADKSVLDTVNFVTTKEVTLRDLSETSKISVDLTKIRGAKIIPDKVELNVPIEPLVKKEAFVTLTATNVPDGQTLLLFPSKVPVTYFVAMSRLSEDDDSDIEIIADYHDIAESNPGKIKVRLAHLPNRLKNFQLLSDSVEFAIVKQ